MNTMKTLLGAGMLTLALFAASTTVSAAEADVAIVIVGGGSGTDYCNGVVEIDGCTCHASDAYCNAGDKCKYYAAGACVVGTFEEVTA